MKKIIIAFIGFFLFTSVFFTGCKKDITDLINLPSNPGDTSFDVPAFTAIGTPVGNPATKTIGIAGGSLVSDDGIIELTIPAGALSADKEITIQPITNECPNGIGLAYDLQPEGTRFAKPATLKFHYTDDDLGEMDPYLFFMAYQDSSSEWMADIIWRDVDTLAKTMTGNIKHFSGHAMGSAIKVYCRPDKLNRNEISNVIAISGITPKPPKGSEESDDDLSALGTPKLLSDVSDWRVSGNVGTISGTGSTATYTAPASIPKKRVVIISATYKVKSSVEQLHYNKGNKGQRGYRSTTSTDAYPVSGRITLIPDTYSYDVKIRYNETGTNACFPDQYADGADMQVDVEGDKVTVSNITNIKPTVLPTTGNNDDGIINCTWLPDDIGVVNIVSATGIVSPTGNVPPGVKKRVKIDCNDGGKAISAKWRETEILSGSISYSGGKIVPGFPTYVDFYLGEDKPQRVDFKSPVGAFGFQSSGYILVTPK